MTTFSLSLSTKGATVVLRPAGYLDNLGAEQIIDAGTDALRNGCRTLELNCTGIRFINSVGISMLVSLIQHAREAGCSLSFSHVSKVHKEVFTVVGITKLVHVLPGPCEAAESRGVRM